MNTWALLKDGQVINVITTNYCSNHMQEYHPEFEIASFHGLPHDVRRAWDERDREV